MSIFEQAAALEQQNIAFAIASIIETKGSSPRHSGKMLVKGDGNIIGTIGGGMIERYVIEQSLEAINEGSPRTVSGRMARTGKDAMGMDCGGAMKIFIDVFCLKPQLILIGAGHVNRAVAFCAHTLGFAITVADSYLESLQPEHFPAHSQLVHGDNIEAAIAKLNITPNSFVIIATNNQDQQAVEQIINQPCQYLGLMASRRKRQVIYDYLRELSVTEDTIAAIHSPIGFNIGAETPEEIAISIMAEVLKVKHDSSGLQMKDEMPHQKQQKLVLIRGAGDIATGVAIRLHNANYKVVMTDIEQPTHIRRSVAFAQALYDQKVTIEGVSAQQVHNLKDIVSVLAQGDIPVIADEQAAIIEQLQPLYVVDAILAKRNMGTHMQMAPFTVALGPGFSAGDDCHVVIETNRGHHLGRLIYQGAAQTNTGEPGSIAGFTYQRVIRAPNVGTMKTKVALGAIVNEGDIVAYVDETPITAPLSGMVRGLLNDGLPVSAGFKIGDIDPRGVKADFNSVSDKARAIAGGVLEALMHAEK